MPVVHGVAWQSEIKVKLEQGDKNKPVTSYLTSHNKHNSRLCRRNMIMASITKL